MPKTDPQLFEIGPRGAESVIALGARISELQIVRRTIADEVGVRATIFGSPITVTGRSEGVDTTPSEGEEVPMVATCDWATVPAFGESIARLGDVAHYRAGLTEALTQLATSDLLGAVDLVEHLARSDDLDNRVVALLTYPPIVVEWKKANGSIRGVLVSWVRSISDYEARDVIPDLSPVSEAFTGDVMEKQDMFDLLFEMEDRLALAPDQKFRR